MRIKSNFFKVFRVIVLYPTRAIIVAIAITFLLSITSGWSAWRAYRDFNDIINQQFRLPYLTEQILYLDEVLTMSARLNAATGDSQWEKRYLSFEPKLDAVIKEVIAISPEIYDNEGAKQTDMANIKLVKMEKESFDLVRRGRKEEALQLLSSDAYNSQKQMYAQGNQVSRTAVYNLIQQRLVVYRQEFLWAGLVALIRLIVIVPLWLIILQAVKKALRDRKTIQDILQRSEERTRATLQALPDLVFRVNRDGQYTDLLTLDQGLDLVNPDRAIGNSIYDLLPSTIIPPHAEAKYSALQQALATQTVQTYEQQVGIENKFRYQEVRVAPCGNDEVVFFIRDITDRKQAELRLQQQSKQEHLLVSITQRMRSSIELVEILKATVEEVHQVLHTDRVLIYQVFPDGTGSPIAESVSPNWSKILDVIFPEEVFPKENYERYVQGRIYTLSDREDENQSVLPCLIDFLTQIQVRAKVVVPIVQNQTLWGLLIAHQCDRPRQWQEWEINLLQQTANQLAIAILQASLFERSQTELAERQRAEARLTETNAQLAISNQELARATRLKDEFLANMSHELRTPLNAILGMTEALQEAVFGTVNEKQIQALQTVERSGSHLLELIDDILDVAKIEAGQIELDCTPTSISGLCQSSLTFIKQQAFQKRIQLDIQIQLNLPDLLVDERRIRQVLINLLNNALKFTLQGGSITLKVTQPFYDSSSSDPSQQCFVHVQVIDTGIGISPENINKLFQPFIQIDNALNRQYTGTGLGLALVKRIVELHGGNVTLTSELGVGSCFTVKLPCNPPSNTTEILVDDKLASTPKMESLLNEEISSQSHLILLADDNEANISTISSYLEAKGYRILLAKNGQEAVDLAITHHPDLILMDIQMPRMNGLEATKKIRLDPNLVNIPIIALTALAMTGDRDRCLQAGATDYLTKPVKLKVLAQMIQTLLAF